MAEGKAAIVVGGVRGLGKAYCEALLREGAKVYMADCLQKQGEETLAEMQSTFPQSTVLFRVCDVTSEASMEEVFKGAKETLGRIDIVVNNAGLMEEFQWEKCIDKGSVRCINLGLQYMGRHNGGDGGVIVVTSSISGFRPEFWGPVYMATKAAMIGLARSFATPMHYNITGVRVNTICPSTVDSTMVEHVQPHRVYFAEETQAALAESKPTWLPPATVAKGLIQIIEDDSINGQALLVTHASGLQYHDFADSAKLEGVQ